MLGPELPDLLLTLLQHSEPRVEVLQSLEPQETRRGALAECAQRNEELALRYSCPLLQSRMTPGYLTVVGSALCVVANHPDTETRLYRRGLGQIESWGG